MRLRLSIVMAIVVLVTAFIPAQATHAFSGECHIVRPGETLSEIAYRYGVTIQAIMEANCLDNPDVIYAGQCLLIPGHQPPKPAPPPAGVKCTMHVVQAGEYLNGIAARYHVSAASIVKLNKLHNPNFIYPGQRLKIKCVTVKPTPQPTPQPGTGTWKGQYWSNRLLSGDPKFIRNSKAIDFRWGSGGPGGGVGPDNFSVRWTSKQTFKAGKYRFHVLVDDGARLWVDGQLLIDQWRDQAAKEYTADKQMTAGTHSLQLDYYENTDQAVIKLWFERVDGAPGEGWLAEYFGNRLFEGPAIISRLEPKIDYDWGTNPPIPGFRPDDFAVRWTREIAFDAANYRFTIEVDDGVQVLIDGTIVIDEWHDTTGGATYVRNLYISGGTHRVRVKYYDAGGPAKIKVSWAKAGAPGPFTAEYFNNTNLQGQPLVKRTEDTINNNWGNKSPAPGVTADYFSVAWYGTFYFKQGTYRFTATMDDGMRVRVDGVLIIDQWKAGGVRTVWTDMALSEGNHDVKVEYFENTGNAVAKLTWAKK